MPIVSRETGFNKLLSIPTGQLPVEPVQPAPSTSEIFGAAFERNNLLGSTGVYLSNLGGVKNTLDPSYSAWDDIKGTPYESRWQEFAQSNNKQFTDALKMQIDQEDQNDRTLAAGGWTSTFANLAAGVLDPTIFIPVGGEIAKGAEAYRLLRVGVRTGAVGGASVAAQEFGLQATQQTRPISESVENIGTGMILSGILGTGVAALLSKPERKLAEDGLNTIINEAGKPASAGAAETSHSLGLENLTVSPEGGAYKIAQATQDLSPGLRLNYSPSPIARQLGQELAESSVYQTGHAEGITVGPAVERLAENTHRARSAGMTRALNSAYADMGKAGTNITWDEFAQAVGHAMSNGDVGVNEFVSRAAREARAATTDPLFVEAKGVGLYDEGDDVKFAESYFPRQYRRDEMIGRENEIKPQLYEEIEKSILASYSKAAEAFRNKVAEMEPEEVVKQTNKFRNKWEGKNLGEGVDPHDPLNVPNFANMSKLIIDDFYEKVTGRDYGSSISVDPEFLTPIKMGPIHERTLPIHDNVLSRIGILEKRADIVLRNFTRMMSGEIELARKYGNPRMDDQFKTLADDYAKLREGVTDPKELEALDKNFRNDQRDIAALRDLVRGTYRMEANTSTYARMVSVANRFNFIRKMGRVVVRSLSDMARPAMVHGLLPYMKDGILPLIRNFEALNLSKAEARLAGIMVDVDLQYRSMALSALTDPFERGTSFERFMESMTRLATKWTLLPKWNDFWKGFEARMAQNEILSGRTSKRTLAMLGIDPATKEKIDAEFAAHGEILDGVYIANTNEWTDENAVRAFRAAVGKQADATIVTPGYADQPLLMHRPTGRLFLQFKSYELAAHSKVLLRGLQENKAKFVAGMISMTTLGMLSSMLGAWSAGKTVWEKYKKSAQNPGYIVGEGLDNSGVFALPFDIANTSERASNSLHYHMNPLKTPIMAVGSWAYPDASQQGKNMRYRDENISDIVGGPTAGTLQDFLVAGSGGVDKLKKGEISRQQQRAAIRLLPFNNFYGISEGIQAITGDSPYGDFNEVAVAKTKKR